MNGRRARSQRVLDISTEIGVAMCEAWGLSANEVLDITVHFHPQELPYAEVELLINEQVLKHVLELVPRDHEQLPG